MKICVNCQLLRDEFSGVDYYIYDLIHNLAAYDEENEYVFFVNSEAAGDCMPEGRNINVERTRFPNRIRPVRIAWEQTCLPYLLLKNRIDLLHSPGYVSPLLSSVPSVVTIPDVIALLFPRLCRRSNYLYYKMLLPPAAKKARRIITLSQNSKRDIVNNLNVPSEKVDVVAMGVHRSFNRIDDAAKLEGIRAKYAVGDRMILFVGNLEPKKNIERIIEAFHVLKRDRGIEHKLVIAGKKGWKYSGIFDAVDKLQLSGDVRFLGYVPREDLPPLYNTADVFVFPSLYEGFGIPPLEAMACGTPVVTSNVSALPEVVGDAAIFVDPGNVGEIAEGIFRVISDGDLRKGLAAKGLKRAKLYSWEKVIDKTRKIYKDTLSR